MKNLSNSFANNFLKIALGSAVLLCSLSLFVFSINKASASEFPDELAQSDVKKLQGTNGVGKYMITMTALERKNGSIHMNYLVWNTETGRSVHYIHNTRSSSGIALSRYQLPSKPL